eukprot:1779642-Amphidinium_carterae.1
MQDMGCIQDHQQHHRPLRGLYCRHLVSIGAPRMLSSLAVPKEETHRKSHSPPRPARHRPQSRDPARRAEKQHPSFSTSFRESCAFDSFVE